MQDVTCEQRTMWKLLYIVYAERKGIPLQYPAWHPAVVPLYLHPRSAMPITCTLCSPPSYRTTLKCRCILPVLITVKLIISVTPSWFFVLFIWVCSCKRCVFRLLMPSRWLSQWGMCHGQESCWCAALPPGCCRVLFNYVHVWAEATWRLWADLLLPVKSKSK